MNHTNAETQTHSLNGVLSDFCSNSTVHGVRYFMEKKLHWFERIWWLIAVISSVIICTLSIQNIWIKWNQNPVIVTFDDETTPISKIPFPAITICPTQKIMNIDLENQPYAMVDSVDKLNVWSQTCSKFNYVGYINGIRSKNNDLNSDVDDDEDEKISLNKTIYEYIKEFAPNKNQTISHAIWIGNSRKIEFKPIFTEEGLCFTFNSINSAEMYKDEIAPEIKTVQGNPNTTYWTVDDSYRININESKLYPFRVFRSGLRDSMQVIVKTTMDEAYHICHGDLEEGFHVALHRPDEPPQLLNDFIYIPAQETFVIAIKPKIFNTSNGLRSYDPNQRGCFFQSERKLHFFKSYSQKKCEFECFTNYTRESCDCVRFWMPRYNHTKVCNLSHFVCYFEAEYNYTNKLIAAECKCRPDCISIEYEFEASQLGAHSIEMNETLDSKLFISFKQHNFIAMKRSETSTISDFISSCGGLLSLFMGMSVISIIELIYFFILRLCCGLRQRSVIPTNLTPRVELVKSFNNS